MVWKREEKGSKVKSTGGSRDRITKGQGVRFLFCFFNYEKSCEQKC